MKKSSTRICFIVNPAADRNRAVRYVDWIHREVKSRFKNAEIVIADENQSISELAQKKSDSFDTIVACGGDGTVNRVVNGIAGTPATLGILPIGNGNDFAKTIYGSRSPAQCMDIISAGNTKKTDLISCRGDRNTWCINTLGLGFDGKANFHAKKFRKLRGSVIYVLGVLAASFTFRGSEMSLSIDNNTLRGDYLLVTACNGQWEGGGFHIAPAAKPWDGIMHLATIETISKAGILWYLPAIWLGWTRFLKKFKIHPCKTVEIRSGNKLFTHCDGEHLGENIQHVKLAVVPGALRVIVP